MNETDDVARYAAAVRRALDDLSAAERAHLTDDLETHLREVAAESDEPLPARLGPPEAYAAELRAAYGARPRRRRRLPRLSRRWRLASLAFFLVIAGLAWLGIARTAGQSASGDRWSSAQLVSQARAGHVRSLEITGSSATATDRSGAQHAVARPDTTASLATEMTRDGVEVDYFQGPGASPWLTVLVPNLALLLVIVAFGVAAYVVIRRRPPHRWAQ